MSIHATTVEIGPTNGAAVDENGAAIEIPFTGTGTALERRPKRVMISSDTPIYYRPALDGETFLAAAMPVWPAAGFGVLVWTLGFTHIFVRAVSTSDAANVRVTGLEG